MRSRVLILFLALLAVWWLIQIPAIFDPLMMFLTLGVNPFTGRELSSLVMAEMLGSALLLSIGILFRKELRRGFTKLFGRTLKQVPPSPLTPSMPVAESLPSPLTVAQAVEYDASSGSTIVTADVQPLPVPDIPSAPITFQQHMHRAPKRRVAVGAGGKHLKRLQGMFAKVCRGVWSLGTRRVIPTTYRAVKASGFFVWKIMRHATEAARYAWWVCEPYCRRFDTWLERKAHQYETTAALVSLGREMEGVARRTVSEVRAWRANPIVLDLLRALRK